MSHPTSSRRFDIVDVFAENRYQGNQLAVVQSAADLSDTEMQQIALETNFSETSFVCGGNVADGFDVRIFTPSFEIPFAGHPTLGTAAVIRMLNDIRLEQVTLNLQVGAVPVRFEESLAWLTAPPTECRRQLDREPIAEALGLRPSDLATDLPVQECSSGPVFTMVPVASLEALENARLDPRQLKSLREAGISDLIYLFVCGARDSRHAMTVRLFFDANGIREDPATGSAAVCLGAYLLKHDVFHSDRIEIKLSQGTSVGRPAVLHLRASHQGIEVGGSVVPIADGNWRY